MTHDENKQQLHQFVEALPEKPNGDYVSVVQNAALMQVVFLFAHIGLGFYGQMAEWIETDTFISSMYQVLGDDPPHPEGVQNTLAEAYSAFLGAQAPDLAEELAQRVRESGVGFAVKINGEWFIQTREEVYGA